MAEVSNNKVNQSMRVLVADDDPPTRILLRAAISQWGYEVVEAKDGEEAWEILQQKDSPQLLILDWLMPKLDGIGLCARIKKENKLHPFIILLTRVTGATNIVKGLEAGADEFLSKPFNMAELRSRLSVGQKLIQFSQSQKHLNDCLDHSEKINQAVTELNLKIDALLTKNNVDTAEIQEIKKNVEKINELIKAVNR